MLPVVALVGRPNVGKSTLFNVLTRSRDALVADLPGVTRDRHYGVCRTGERPFVVVDTGGLSGVEEAMDVLTATQVRVAIAEANVLVEMLQAVGKNLNTKTFDQMVNGGKFVSYKTAPSGSPGKLIWPAAHFIPADCAAVVKVSGTNYTVSEPFKCYSSYNIPG